MDWDTVKVRIWQKALLQMQTKFTKLINTLGFFVFIIFQDLGVLFSNLMVCQRSVKMLCPLKNNFVSEISIKTFVKIKVQCLFYPWGNTIGILKRER